MSTCNSSGTSKSPKLYFFSLQFSIFDMFQLDRVCSSRDETSQCLKYSWSSHFCLNPKSFPNQIVLLLLCDYNNSADELLSCFFLDFVQLYGCFHGFCFNTNKVLFPFMYLNGVAIFSMTNLNLIFFLLLSNRTLVWNILNLQNYGEIYKISLNKLSPFFKEFCDSPTNDFKSFLKIFL